MRRFASGFSLVRCPPAERQITRSKLFGGLVAAHDKGVLHRDLKPENIFLTSDGRIENDFGVAKLRRPEGDFASVDAPTVASQIGAGVVLGAVAYMSPEQIRGKPADTRSDLFCVGAILYEMVSGKRAFRGDTAADAMSAIGCEQDGGLDLAKFIHLGRTSQLAEGVANENRARHLFAEQIAGMRQDGCHASAHVVATGDGRLPDLNASNIGDRIQRAGGQDANSQPQIRGAGSCIGTCVLRDRGGGRQQDHHGCENLLGHVVGQSDGSWCYFTTSPRSVNA